MQKIWILIMFSLLPLSMVAQQNTDYNKKGDEALIRADYTDARMWFEEGVIYCNKYSINRLTEIWLNNETMRSSMRSLMNKTLNCLTVMANEDDTTAIVLLKTYYQNGIGIPENQDLANHWDERLNQINRRNDLFETISTAPDVESPKVYPMHFFVGYNYSVQSPFGITVGGIKHRMGWYARFRSDFSFSSGIDYTCKGSEEMISIVPDNTPFRFTNKKKTDNLAALGGFIVKCTPWLYTSLGLGYGTRKTFCEFVTLNDTDYRKEQAYWAKNTDYSYNGLAADFDIMIRFGSFFISGGCNTLNFKYIDLNAGTGIFF